MEKASVNIKQLANWLKSSKYSFPVILIIILIVLTVFGIHGSSMGIYHKSLHGNQAKDPDLIFGQPKSIRSDEYLIFTPRVASQTQSDYPAFSEKIGSGREMVITPEAPIQDWVSLFRPHTTAYFVLPFSNAFAFAWWFGLFALIISSYFFILRILGERKLLAILLSISIALSPFILWWYQVGLLLSMAFFFVAVILLMRLINRERVKFVKSQRISDLLHTAALIYIGASFGLLLYAPFLIPIAIVLVVIMAGYVIDGLKSGALKLERVKKSFVLISLAFSVTAIIGAVFYFDRQEMIKTIAGSVYPGNREAVSGQLPFSPIYRFFDSFLMPLLPRPPTGSFYTNQSETANFILLLPFLIIPGILLQIYDYIKSKRVNWTLLLIELLVILFILRISVPIADGFFKLLLLDKVPNNRLMVGVGLLGFLILIYLIQYLPKVKIPKRTWSTFSIVYSVLVLTWLLVFSRFFFNEYLEFKYNYLVVGMLALFFTAIIAAFMFNKKVLGAVLLLVFTLLSSYNILPLQRGMTFFEESRIVNSVQSVSDPGDSWAVVDNFTFESLPLIAGRQLINGPQPYTDFDFWRQIDKDGKYEDVYNRQAHAIFVSNTAEPSVFLPKSFARTDKELELVKGNVFKVKFACSEFVYENINFVLTTHELNLPCTNLMDKVSYPKAIFYIYKIEPVK